MRNEHQCGSHFGLEKIILSSYLSTTITQGFLTDYEGKASHARQHWTLGHVGTVEHRAGQRDQPRVDGGGCSLEAWLRSVLARIQMQVLVQCAHDGGTGCNLIGCSAQSFGAGGKTV